MSAADAGMARPYVESLGAAGVLFCGGGPSIAVGEGRLWQALEGLPDGHLLVLEEAPEEADSLRAFLGKNRWIAHLPAGLAERLRDEAALLGRVSAIAPGLSFLIDTTEVDVLPRGPETPGLSLLLDWQGVLLCYPAVLPTRRSAEEWWRTFHLARFLLPFPGRESIINALPGLPLVPGDAERLAEAESAAHLFVETGGTAWRAWVVRPGERLFVSGASLRPPGEE